MYYYFCTNDAELNDIKPYDAESVLRFLGGSGGLFGFGYAVYMVEQIMEDPGLLALITKRLYPETGKHFEVSDKSVERNLRTLIQRCWKNASPHAWQEIAGRKMSACPTNGEFLDMIVAYLKKNNSSVSNT